MPSVPTTIPASKESRERKADNPEAAAGRGMEPRRIKDEDKRDKVDEWIMNDF